MAAPYLNIGIALLLLLAVGCGPSGGGQPETEEIQSEGEADVGMDQSVQLIMDAGGLDQDSAQGTMETLNELGVEALTKAELISNNRGVVLQVWDSEDHVYFLGYGGLGYLEIVRRDSADGEILYAPEE